jgi:hypothetical protein
MISLSLNKVAIAVCAFILLMTTVGVMQSTSLTGLSSSGFKIKNLNTDAHSPLRARTVEGYARQRNASRITSDALQDSVQADRALRVEWYEQQYMHPAAADLEYCDMLSGRRRARCVGQYFKDPSMLYQTYRLKWYSKDGRRGSTFLPSN